MAALPVPDSAKDLDYVMNAVKEIRRELNGRVPLIGFSGSPWTLATYMVEGGSSKDFRHIKEMMYATPEVMHALLDKLAQSVTDYLNQQILSGAQAVQIFDTWGGVLSGPMYQEFSLRYMQQIISGLIREHEGRKVPVIMFTKNGGQWLETMAEAGADALGLTGPQILMMPVPVWVTALPCRGIWIRAYCMPRRNVFVRKWVIFWVGLAQVQVMCLIWDMVFTSLLIRNDRKRSLMRFTN